MVLTGTIKNYNIERGFGFISTSNFGDVFFHIKDFQKGEQPIVGREVYFEVVKKENKNRAIHVYYSDHEQTHDKQKSLPLYLWIIFISIAIGVAYLGSIQLKKYLYKDNQTTNAIYQKPVAYKCDGRRHCSQMRSKEEADWFVKNCPDTMMDGDGDGDACENDSRW